MPPPPELPLEAGLIALYDEVTLELSASFGRSGTSASHGVAASAVYTSNFATGSGGVLDTGCEIRLFNTEGAGIPDDSYARIQIPALAVNEIDDTGAWRSSLSGRLKFTGYKLLRISGGWKLKWTAIQVYLNGALVHTVGAGSLSNLLFESAIGIPLFGVPPKGESNTDINPTIFAGTVGPASTTPGSVSVTGNVSWAASWTVKEPGAVTSSAYPVTLSLPDRSSAEGCCGSAVPMSDLSATTTGDPSGTSYMRYTLTTTYEGTITCNICPDGHVASTPATFEEYKTEGDYRKASSNVRPVPNLSRKVWRLNNEFYELVLRFGMPRVTSSSSMDCRTSGVISDPPIAGSVHRTDFPGQAIILSGVGNSAHVIEDTFSYAVLSPATRGGHQRHGIMYQYINTVPGLCGVVGIGEGDGDGMGDDGGSPPVCSANVDSYCEVTEEQSAVDGVQSVVENPYMAFELHHDDLIGRYINYSCTPHQSYFSWFPQNVGPDQSQWQIDATNINVSYFIEGRTQWANQALLPTPEKHRTRLHMPSSPLREGIHSGYWEGAFMGVPTALWGICRPVVKKPDCPASIQLTSASSSDWTATNTTPTFGASQVSLIPTVGSVSEIAYNIGNTARIPFMFPHLSDRIGLTWSVVNVHAVEIVLVGQAGDEVVISTGSQGVLAKPQTGMDSKYAQSGRHEHGGNYLSGEYISDTLPEGISTAVVADTEYSASFSLITGQDAEKLVYRITHTNPALPVNIDYPTFYSPANKGVVYHENGHTAIVVHKNGPANRFGTLAWYDDTAHVLLTTPLVVDPGFPPLGWKSTVIDYLVWQQFWIMGADTSGILADLATIWDADEGNGSYQTGEDYTISFIHQPPSARADICFGFLVNTFREVGPLCTHPMRERDSDFQINASGNFVQHAYSLCQEVRHIIAEDEVHLFDPVGSQVSTPSVTDITPWKDSYYNLALNNDEAPYSFKQGAEEFASGRPWYSLLVDRRITNEDVLGFHLTVSPERMFHAVKWRADDHVLVHSFNHEGKNWETDLGEFADVQSAQIAWSPDGHLLVVIDQNATPATPSTSTISAVELRRLGQSAGSPAVIFSGSSQPVLAVDHFNGDVYIALREGSSYNLYRKKNSETLYDARATITDAALPIGRMEIDHTIARGLHFVQEEGGNLVFRRSFDLGDSWGEEGSLPGLTHPALAHDPGTGIIYCMGYDGANWVLCRRNSDASLWETVANVLTKPVAYAGLEVWSAPPHPVDFITPDTSAPAKYRVYSSWDRGAGWSMDR